MFSVFQYDHFKWIHLSEFILFHFEGTMQFEIVNSFKSLFHGDAYIQENFGLWWSVRTVALAVFHRCRELQTMCSHKLKSLECFESEAHNFRPESRRLGQLSTFRFSINSRLTLTGTDVSRMRKNDGLSMTSSNSPIKSDIPTVEEHFDWSGTFVS